ncbi:hypothetical protein K491DRAFT_709443 [Lophiostoma macrostomum CBS 122681]|uniref:Uncharacterized protein n=1 Tax=Lophiostoma macrostomum CBS 122681 TaxID=1314788 RepID=A0A6A6TSK4_9PLEO|nr:hypothetical protein K491DRAFT_709443 [Lophiostoma macrostomum CBS 122681]
MDDDLQSRLAALEATAQQNADVIANLQTEITGLKQQNVEDEKTLSMLRASSLITTLGHSASASDAKSDSDSDPTSDFFSTHTDEQDAQIITSESIEETTKFRFGPSFSSLTGPSNTRPQYAVHVDVHPNPDPNNNHSPTSIPVPAPNILSPSPPPTTHQDYTLPTALHPCTPGPPPPP